MMGYNAKAQFPLAYQSLEVLLQLRNSSSQPFQSNPSSKLSFTHATYKITQKTKKISASLLQQDAILLLHLSDPTTQIYLKASDAMGQQVMSIHYPAMEAGFYEIPMLPSATPAPLYFISLVINQKTYSFQISPAP